MATLGTFTAGQVLTAAELNAIGTWDSYTANVRASFGSFTSVTLYDTTYTKLNDLVILRLLFKIDNVGTGGGSNILFDLPEPTPFALAYSGYGIGYGRENGLTGKMVQVLANSTTVGLINYYDNSAPSATGFQCGVVAVYRRT